MNRIVPILALVLLAMPAAAQNPPAAAVPAYASVPRTEQVGDFSQVEIDGPIRVHMVAVADGARCRVVYDTHNSPTSKFKASVNKSGVLQISESTDPKRDSITTATVFYNSLTALKVSHADVHFDSVLKTRLFDLSVSGGATVKLHQVDMLDLCVECTGRSAVELKGSSRYFKIDVSTAKVNAAELNTMASTVNASHAAEVDVAVAERLEAVTSTGAKLRYRGRPDIIRNRTSLFGGEIIHVDN